RMEVIIHSMTAEERVHPEVLNGSRRARIARGAGVTVTDVNQLIKKFNETKKMLKQVMPALGGGKGGGKKRGKQRKRRRGLPGMQGMNMDDMKKLQQMLDDQK
ncbi:MAG: signal recognition particle protein, partial [Eggerthellaceae bacterium]|nr:signal recognition particle protein [Eggerthellaceae bacterium]